MFFLVLLKLYLLVNGHAVLQNWYRGVETRFVVVVVMTTPSGTAYMGGQMSRRDEEFHQTLVVLEHI